MIEEVAYKIEGIIGDYHHDHDTGVRMSASHIVSWANQFGKDDGLFVLHELHYLLNQHPIYVSKEEARRLLYNNINQLAKFYKYTTLSSFLSETVFLQLQPEEKSQHDLLQLLDELLVQKGTSLSACGKLAQKNFVYIDDVLATGKTILNDVKNWMEENDNENLHKIDKGRIRFAILLFCTHSWAENNIRWSLKVHFNADLFTSPKLFPIISYYRIGNNIKGFNEPLNLALPLRGDDKCARYLASLVEARNYEDRAYRNPNQPSKEVFFSSAANRDKFETILIHKGIEIISKIKDEEKRSLHRPLGKTYPHYKTLGTGTLFFTWRNISNTCPIVFWWDNLAHDWHGLFPLRNRGKN